MPRCAKSFYFTACKGIERYRVIVRYIKFRRFVIVRRLGYCINLYLPGAFKS